MVKNVYIIYVVYTFLFSFMLLTCLYTFHYFLLVTDIMYSINFVYYTMTNIFHIFGSICCILNYLFSFVESFFHLYSLLYGSSYTVSYNNHLFGYSNLSMPFMLYGDGVVTSYSSSNYLQIDYTNSSISDVYLKSNFQDGEYLSSLNKNLICYLPVGKYNSCYLLASYQPYLYFFDKNSAGSYNIDSGGIMSHDPNDLTYIIKNNYSLDIFRASKKTIAHNSNITLKPRSLTFTSRYSLPVLDIVRSISNNNSQLTIGADKYSFAIKDFINGNIDIGEFIRVIDYSVQSNELHLLNSKCRYISILLDDALEVERPICKFYLEFRALLSGNNFIIFSKYIICKVNLALCGDLDNSYSRSLKSNSITLDDMILNTLVEKLKFTNSSSKHIAAMEYMRAVEGLISLLDNKPKSLEGMDGVVDIYLKSTLLK